MDVLDTPPLLLANAEVLQFVRQELHEQDAALAALHAARSSHDKAARKEGKTVIPRDQAHDIARLIQPENVHTVQKAVAEWLADTDLVTVAQSAKQVDGLTRSLVAFDTGLSKIEILQLVNTLPRAMPELYVIIEQFEERFDESRQSQLFELIQSHAKSSSSDTIMAIEDPASRPPADAAPAGSPVQEDELDDEEAELAHDTDEEEEDAMLVGTAGRSTVYQGADLEIDEVAES